MTPNSDLQTPADHGGGLDGAVRTHGGVRGDWLDLSTGINPRPYPVPDLPADAWTRRGTASNHPVSVRAIAWISAGHLLHHMSVIQDRYL